MTVLVSSSLNPDAAIAQVLSQARSVIGRPYIWAGTFEHGSGGDCSGLVVYAFKHGAGIMLPHFTGFLLNQGHEVSKAELQPGDLVFPDSHHVQIYSGNGNIIESPERGKNVREIPMWGFWRARRIITGGTGTVTSTQALSGGTQGLLGLSVPNPLAPLIDVVNKFLGDARSIALRFAEFVIGGMLVVAGAAELGWTNPQVKSLVKTGARLAK
jgi:NlpC/P60 family